MNTLTCPYPIFQRLVQILVENPQRPLFVSVGHRQGLDSREWLVMAISRRESIEPLFRVMLTASPPSRAELSAVMSTPVVGTLFIGSGSYRGYWWGAVRVGEQIKPLERLALVGAGMHNLPAIRQPEVEEVSVRLSRTIGALGEEAIWRRLVEVPMAIVGCGRTGSLVAVTLARLGVRQLTLIDPDHLEPHNLGEMDGVTDADLGRPKVAALADHLRTLGGDKVIPIVASITDKEALAAAKASRLLFCCADNDAARLASALLATLYHRVLVDIGTGIHFISSQEGAHQQRTMGGDVRLILPTDGCLLCRGNLTNYARAVDDLCNHRSPTALPPEAWRAQRAGSLRTLNQLAAALGVQMVQDLVAGRLTRSTWAQLTIDQTGRLSVTYPPTANDSSCLLCAKAGMGDNGIAWGT